MKRRGFFKAFAALLAAPIVAKAMPEIPARRSDGTDVALTEEMLVKAFRDVRATGGYHVMGAADAYVADFGVIT